MNKEIQIAGKKIFYRLIGSGKPVVLIHGFGEDGDVWKNQIDQPPPGFAPNLRKTRLPPKEGLHNAQGQLSENSLLKNFQFIVPDLPGSGKSEMIDDMSMEGMAEVIKQILDTEFPKVPPSGGFRGALIGHSMGGYIALAFAEKYPEYLTAFGLFQSSAYADSEEKKAARRKSIEFIEQHGAFEFLKTATPNLFSSFSKDEMPERIGEFINSLSNFSPAALVSYYKAMMQRPDRTEVLKKIKVPVLFIMGEYDNAIPLNDVLQQCHLPEKSYIHLLAKSGHMGMIEEADKSNRFLENFLLSN
jgi:pimeloyl-ACP methyl ester carboxylesterase